MSVKQAKSVNPRDPIIPTKLYTPYEVSKLMGVSNHFVYRQLIENKISSIWLGKGRKILGENILSYLRNQGGEIK